ncbi:MAG: rhodanese-like domain-containing protein [Candidatus Thalassarchaeaceae archaeon]|nr:rhodanese-like domain-containing protein [Candidatus Thalassarchaeaceae archaeon]
MQSENIVNIAGYRFVNLDDRDDLRQPFRYICEKLQLKGTILLSPNGINFFLAGVQKSIDSYIEFLESDERFVGIPLKISHTEYQPFRRMLVRLKKEIIALGIDEVRPGEFTGANIKPVEFKQMLDENEEVIVLDTRNDYETKIGIFENAIDLNLSTFKDFPDAILALPEEYKKKQIVMYCTGGIRCEKASVVMMNAGFENVKQLEGGVLGYFEQTDGSYWKGDCFVFDQRVAVNTELNETEYTMCFACREPLTKQECSSSDYKLESYCPYCADTNKNE